MEATYYSTITKTKYGDQGALFIEVPDKAFEVYKRIYRLKPLYPTETMAYWTCLSARGFILLFSYLSCCSSSALKGLLLECEELIAFCISMDQIIRNKLVDLHFLHLPFQLSRMEKCLELLSDGNPQFKFFNLKLVSVEVWRDIHEIIKSINFPFRRERDEPLAVKETHYEFSKCNSPKSILDANSQFSESTSFSSEDLDASEGSSLSEEDISYFKELLSFALESPPSTKKPVSKSKAVYNYGSGNPVHDDKTCAMFSSSAPYSPLMKSQPSGNIYSCFNSFTDKAIAVPPYPPMDSLKKDSLKCPTKIPAFEASRKCSDQSPQYTCPRLLFTAMENQLGYIKNSNSPISPKPKFNMKPPNFPIFPQPSSAAAPSSYYDWNNMAGPFNNVGIPPIRYSAPYMPPPVNHCSAPLPFKVPLNQCTNGGTYNSQQLYYNFRDSRANSGYSIETFESELQELLRGRRKPIRISVLPAMYEERFHKPINSSHEKLSALLSKCRNIVLVYRQGGQHVMMLKHDESLPAVKVSRRKNRCLDPRSRKVYLTFPPGSTFTSDDAEAYFRQFGPVRGVRMSHEEPPTYAFVEFYTCEAALSALCNTKAHYISGQKVMVKPYRQSSAYKF